MSFVDQLPCGSVLTPAISYTKFQIHLAPADTPKAKTGSGTVVNGLQIAKFVIISEHGGPGKPIV